MMYIGNFLHQTNQEETSESERRHGEFNLIVQAESRDAAIGLFKERIQRQRETSGFFEGDCSIFFVELLEFEKIPETEAMILNFKSIAGDPLMPFIACSVPTGETDACRVIDWNNNGLEVDGKTNKLFLTFNKTC